MPHKLGCIILAAGKGTRMKSSVPKPLHKIAGREMVQHVIAAAEALAPEKIVVVTAPGAEAVAEAVRPYLTCVQEAPDGTGGAVRAAAEHFKGFDGDILVLFSDTPLVSPETLQKLVDARRQFPAVGVIFAAMHCAEPGSYGRMVTDADGTLLRIVEAKDATAEEKKITLCNGGIVCADGAKLFSWLEKIGSANAQGERYLTDLAALVRKDNRLAHAITVPAEEMEGVNTRADLARLENLCQQKLREKHMAAGATLIAPETVTFSFDTIVGEDVTIEPNVFFGAGVTLRDGATVRGFSHLEGADVGAGASVGPFARLRAGSVIGAGAHIGNFVETKNATLGAGVKAGHLSYLGDAEVGDRANIGAGVITCNYDGFLKHRTVIGKDSFIGSNSALVAPVTVGTGAFVAAGSVISRAVPDQALGISRAPQIVKDGWVPAFRQKKIKEKAQSGK